MIKYKPKFKWVKDSKDAIPFITTDTMLISICTEIVTDILRSKFPIDIQDKKIWFTIYGKLATVKGVHTAPMRNQEKDTNGYLHPAVSMLETLTQDLSSEKIKTVKQLMQWYYAFQLIMPLRHFNKEIAGIVTAILSSKLHPRKGFMVEDKDSEMSRKFLKLNI
jgi:hypothetical protein